MEKNYLNAVPLRAVQEIKELLNLEENRLTKKVQFWKEKGELNKYQLEECEQFLRLKSLTATIIETFTEMVLTGGLDTANDVNKEKNLLTEIYKPLLEMSERGAIAVFNMSWNKYRSDISEFFVKYEKMEDIPYSVQTSMYLFFKCFVKYDSLTLDDSLGKLKTKLDI